MSPPDHCALEALAALRRQRELWQACVKGRKAEVRRREFRFIRGDASAAHVAGAKRVLEQEQKALQAAQRAERRARRALHEPKILVAATLVAARVAPRARQHHRGHASQCRSSDKPSGDDDGPGSDRCSLTPTDRVRLRRGAEHLHRLGARAIAEFIVEDADCPRRRQRALDRLDAWRVRLTPELLRAVGGDRFPPDIALVPDDLDEGDMRS
jgi:hypothetical protein